MPETIGLQFIGSLIEKKDPAELVQMGEIAYLFTDSELATFEFVQQHVVKHGAIPTADTIATELDVDITEGKFVEPPSYYAEKLRQRHVERVLKRTLIEASERLTPGQKEPMKALEEVQSAVFDLAMKSFGTSLCDFRDSFSTIIPAYSSLFKGVEGGVELGWPSLDRSTNGLRAGDVVAVVGRPGLGKTWMLLYSALWHWVRQQGVPLFVSMEMNPQLIQERLASMQTHIPLSLIKNGDLDTFRLKKLKGSLKALAKMPQPFHIVDGNLTATVDDLYVLARQLKPSCVYVDGAYLLRLEKSRDRFTRAADNCEALKSRIASELGIPVITSWQFNRNHEKQSKGKASLTDIGYSDAVGQISSICLGLTENDSVETIAKRKVDIMKGRSGETGTFYLKWDFNSMDFGEVDITETNPLAWLS